MQLTENSRSCCMFERDGQRKEEKGSLSSRAFLAPLFCSIRAAPGLSMTFRLSGCIRKSVGLPLCERYLLSVPLLLRDGLSFRTDKVELVKSVFEESVAHGLISKVPIWTEGS